MRLVCNIQKDAPLCAHTSVGTCSQPQHSITNSRGDPGKKPQNHARNTHSTEVASIDSQEVPNGASQRSASPRPLRTPLVLVDPSSGLRLFSQQRLPHIRIEKRTGRKNETARVEGERCPDLAVICSALFRSKRATNAIIVLRSAGCCLIPVKRSSTAAANAPIRAQGVGNFRVHGLRLSD
eukprot:2952121-Rhodomonas_salina.1